MQGLSNTDRNTILAKVEGLWFPVFPPYKARETNVKQTGIVCLYALALDSLYRRGVLPIVLLPTDRQSAEVFLLNRVGRSVDYLFLGRFAALNLLLSVTISDWQICEDFTVATDSFRCKLRTWEQQNIALV